MSRWLLPLAAISETAGFNTTYIESEDHYQTTTVTDSSVWPWRSYKTSPHHPPHMNITRHNGELSKGYIFLSPSDHTGTDGTYELSGTGFIMTTDGDMIYAAEERGYGFCDEWVAGMTDFRRQDYKGRPYITYWNGCNTQGAHWGHRWGRVTFIDEEYNNFTVNPDFSINTLDEANRGQIDMHDHQMTEDDTMVVTTYHNVQKDLSGHKGVNITANNTWIAESMFCEFDIESGEVLFKWSAMDHIPLKLSHWGLKGNRGTRHVPWDWFHINSVQKVGKNYLVSARHHWAVYLVSGKDGHVIWNLNGIGHGSWGMIPSRFRWQHHARAHNVTEHGMIVSLFNNHVAGIRNRKTQSQALAFYVPLPASRKKPIKLLRRLQTHDDMAFSSTQGSYQLDLSNGHGFVGYGKVPLLREYGPAQDGRDLRWQARFGHDSAVMSYRAFKAEWRGTPKNWDPIAVFEPLPTQHNKPAHVFVSWNGATDISDWAIFAGSTRDNLTSVGMTRRMGFETTFQLPKAQCVQLGAVRDGKIIRASNVACQGDPPLVFDERPSKIGGGNDLGSLLSQKDALESDIAALESELSHLASGVWVSYTLFIEVTMAVIALVSAIWSLRFWRDRRRRKSYIGVLGSDPDLPHRRVASGLGLRVFSSAYDKRKVSPMVQSVETFEELKMGEGAATGRRRRTLDDNEHFGLTHEDDYADATDEDEEGTATSRLPFVRQSTGLG